MNSKQVVSIKANGATCDYNPSMNGPCPSVLFNNLVDLFMKKLPRWTVGNSGVIDNIQVKASCIASDRRDESFHSPRQFIVAYSATGRWMVEAYFGWNGSHNQAIKFLKILAKQGVKEVTASGPLNKKDHWSEESISPVDLIKLLEKELVPAIV